MEKIKVLIVDDSSFIRRAISKVFELDPEFQVIGIARNGIEALEKINLIHPDVVAMDAEMPEMDGLEALSKIMKISPLPVVILSSKTIEGTQAVQRALEIGAADFFLKEDIMGESSLSPRALDFLDRFRNAARMDGSGNTTWAGRESELI